MPEPLQLPAVCQHLCGSPQESLILKLWHVANPQEIVLVEKIEISPELTDYPANGRHALSRPRFVPAPLPPPVSILPG